jgi:hypothetical protein
MEPESFSHVRTSLLLTWSAYLVQKQSPLTRLPGTGKVFQRPPHTEAGATRPFCLHEDNKGRHQSQTAKGWVDRFIHADGWQAIDWSKMTDM